MKLASREENGFYLVTELCSTTTHFIASCAQGLRRKVAGGWLLHESQIPALFKKAKATGFHAKLDYTIASATLKTRIDVVLGKTKAKLTIVTPVLDEGSHATLYVIPTAPMCVIKAAWRALSAEYHPDKGGNPETFIKIQEAFDDIQKKVTP